MASEKRGATLTRKFKSSYQLITILIVILFTQVFELILLLRKYDLFSIGFLQPYSYLEASDRTYFLAVGLWTDLFIITSIGALWFWASKKLSFLTVRTAYNFVFISCAVIGVWLAIKFKVLSYFNDTINFHIMRNLGGGTLISAFQYAANEATYIVFCIFLLITAYWIGYRIIRSSAAGGRSMDDRAQPAFLGILIIGFVITIGVLLFTESDPALRYGLNKKTSYSLIKTAIDTITDFDSDGYGIIAFPTDPDGLDPNLYPGALDHPNNGIDENGYGGDFNSVTNAADALESLEPTAGKHIIMIVLESARADIIGRKFKNRLVAPTLTQLATTGSNIQYAYTHTGFTTSSLKALFNRTLSESKDKIGLVEYLRTSGYQLSFISGQDESFGDIAKITGMTAAGNYFFDAASAIEDRVFLSKSSASLRLSEERVLRQFVERGQKVDWSRPQYFYVNFQAAHFSYHHPNMPTPINDNPIPRSEISEKNRAWLEATYWNAIAVADDAVNKIMDYLVRIGVYENTTIVITGDHGESLFDDRLLGHGHALNEIQTRVPLIVNESGIELNSAIGQTDMAELIVRVATNRLSGFQSNLSDKPILQIIGDLDHPQLIGIVSAGEIRTILDPRIRKVFFNDLQRWEDFENAWDDPELQSRTRTLIEIWEQAQWSNFLSTRSADP